MQLNIFKYCHENPMIFKHFIVVIEDITLWGSNPSLLPARYMYIAFSLFGICLLFYLLIYKSILSINLSIMLI